MMRDTILRNWRRIIDDFQTIADLDGTDYPAYTARFGDSYGVAVKYDGGREISESFAGAKIWTAPFSNSAGEKEYFLLLTSKIEDIKEQFALLCEAFVDPGDDGIKRIALIADPVGWWKSWKMLLGNKSVDERIYDVLGEMCALLYAVENCRKVEWNGPFGATYDIEAEEEFIEAKSTVNKLKSEITINNQFQLQPAGDKPLKLIRCVFEPSVSSGMSINDVCDKLIDVGFDASALNERLEMRGFEKGMSARDRKFLLQQMLLYEIDDTFPRITPDSFKDGHLPESIKDISYTVDMSGQKANALDVKKLLGTV